MAHRECEYCRESTQLIGDGDCHCKMRIYRAECFCGAKHFVCAKCRKSLMGARGVLGDLRVALRRCPESEDR